MSDIQAPQVPTLATRDPSSATPNQPLAPVDGSPQPPGVSINGSQDDDGDHDSIPSVPITEQEVGQYKEQDRFLPVGLSCPQRQTLLPTRADVQFRLPMSQG